MIVTMGMRLIHGHRASPPTPQSTRKAMLDQLNFRHFAPRLAMFAAC